MLGEQDDPEYLLLHDEVPDGPPGEPRARRAGAAWVQWLRGEGMLGVAQVERPVRVKAVPILAVRVGRTQSKMSTPRAMTSTSPSGSPMPMK